MRFSYNQNDLASVARIVMAMGSTEHVDEIHRVLAAECTNVSKARFAALLREFRVNDLPPRHAVELYRAVEFWFVKQIPELRHWNEVIHALVRNDDIQDALALVQSLEREEALPLQPKKHERYPVRYPAPDAFTYTGIILALGEHRGPGAAVKLFSRMSLMAIEPDFVCYLSMVVMYCRQSEPNLEAAKLWLRKAEHRMLREGDLQEYPMNKRGVMLYNTMMSAYVKANRMKDAFSVLGCMRMRGIVPSVYSFQILQNACLVNSPYGTEECRQLLRMMQQIGVEPSTSNYNVLIHAYGTTGQLTSALRVANRMREAGVPWDQHTYFYLICAVNSAGQVELSLRLLAKMRKDGVRPTSKHYTMAFVGLAGAGFYEDAGRVFRRLVSLKDIANQFAYNMMISICCRRGDMDAAREVQQQMEDNGLASSIMTYRILLEGYSQDMAWDAALELRDPVHKLRQQLEDVVENPAATDVARREAQSALTDKFEKRNWQKAYYLLIDAAVWSGNWNIGVRLLEELIESGLQPSLRKHARLFLETKRSVRFGPAANILARPSVVEDDQQALAASAAQDSWLQRSPRVLQTSMGSSRPGWAQGGGFGLETGAGLAVGSNAGVPSAASQAGGADAGGEEDVVDAVLVPPHMFCASFSPDWLTDASPESENSLPNILERCLEGGGTSSVDLYRLVHDYHHATAYRRTLATLRLQRGKSAIFRTSEETPDTLRKLFDTFGRPGTKGAPAYVFLRPAAAQLDALLALLALGALHPTEVLLLRPNEPDGVEKLVEQCKERGDRPLSYSLTSLLASMPAGLLVNLRLMVANASHLKKGSAVDFDIAFRSALSMPAIPYAKAPRTWIDWLTQQRLRQLARADRGEVRLDGVRQRAVMSKADLFRARCVADDQVTVDLFLEDEGEVVEFRG